MALLCIVTFFSTVITHYTTEWSGLVVIVGLRWITVLRRVTGLRREIALALVAGHILGYLDCMGFYLPFEGIE